MMAIATDLLVLILVIALLYKAQPAQPFSGAIHEDYLSLESGNCLRGLLSIVIVVHHLAQNCSGFLLFPLFSKLGFQTVAVFFFLSGYGLMKQYIHRPDYHHHFLRRRLPAIVVPYVIATIIFWAAWYLMGDHKTIASVLYSFVSGFPIVTPSWFIIGLILFYIAFKILMMLWGNRYNGLLISAGVFCVLYALICYHIGYGLWWYNTIITIAFGMVWALYEGRINGFFQKKYWIAAPMLFLLFIIQYGSKILLNPYLTSIAAMVALTWITSILFTICVLLVIMKLKLANPLLHWLGRISLETYLYHYLFILLLRSPLIDITSDFAYVALVILCTLVMAQLMHWVNTQILNMYKKLCK